MKFIELLPGVDPEVHDGRGIATRILAGLGGVSGQPGLNDLFVEVSIPPRYYGRSADFGLNQGQTAYVDVPLGPSVLGADAGVWTPRVVLSSRSRGVLDSKDFPGAVTILPAGKAPQVVSTTATAVNTVQSAPSSAPSGAAGWIMRISQAPTIEDLDAVRSEFETAYTSGQIDQATYQGFYNQYLARWYALQGTASPTSASSPQTQEAPETVATAPPQQSPSGMSGWALRISQASTISDLETVRSEFETAYISGQIDQATYQGFYNQYLARFNNLSGASVSAPTPVSAPTSGSLLFAGPVNWLNDITIANSVQALAAVRSDFESAYQASIIDQTTYQTLFNAYQSRYNELTGAPAESPTPQPTPEASVASAPTISSADFITRMAAATTRAELDTIKAEFEDLYTSGKMEQDTYTQLYDTYNAAWYNLSA